MLIYKIRKVFIVKKVQSQIYGDNKLKRNNRIFKLIRFIHRVSNKKPNKKD